jgi:hypothetical protein
MVTIYRDPKDLQHLPSGRMTSSMRDDIIVKNSTFVSREDFVSNSLKLHVKYILTYSGLKAFLPGSGQVRRDLALKGVRS